MRKTILFTVCALILCSSAYAKRTKYIATNHRYNYVKLVEVKAKDAKQMDATQPVNVDKTVLAEAFRNLRVARKHLTNENVSTLDIFTPPSVGYLSTNVAKALQEASTNDSINFSYLVKTPIVVIRKDRLSTGKIWMSDDGLHVKFGLLKAPIFGDTNKRGYEYKVVKKRRGVRLQLEYSECQKPGNSLDEIILDLNCYAKNMNRDDDLYKQANSSKTTKSTAKNNVAATPVVTPTTPDTKGTTEERLKKLDELKNKKLITNKEYKMKRKKILEDL